MRRIIAAMLLILVMMLAACTPAAPAAEAPAAEATEAPAEATEAPAEEAAAEATEAPAEEAPAAEGEAVTLPEVNPLEVTGDIISAGSSTVFPLSEAMAERFTDEGYAGNMTIDSVGTGGGFERFCVAGETDIANASRAIKDQPPGWRCPMYQP